MWDIAVIWLVLVVTTSMNPCSAIGKNPLDHHTSSLNNQFLYCRGCAQRKICHFHWCGLLWLRIHLAAERCTLRKSNLAFLAEAGYGRTAAHSNSSKKIDNKGLTVSKKTQMAHKI